MRSNLAYFNGSVATDSAAPDDVGDWARERRQIGDVKLSKSSLMSAVHPLPAFKN